MDCDLPEDSAWPALLQARAALLRGGSDLALVQREGAWSCEAAAAARRDGATQVAELTATEPERGEVPRARWTIHRQQADGRTAFVHPSNRPIDAEMQSLLRIYAPILRGAADARAKGRVFVVGHVTQTIDGRIACVGGAPEWLGNAADRRHTHRMRALLDAVLVGAATAKGDDPQLTVREVAGHNPRRVVLSGSGSVLATPRTLRVFADHGADVIVAAGNRRPAPLGARVIELPEGSAAQTPLRVLESLRELGVRSLFLEGGAKTLSSFLAAGCIDLLQVHVAPVVLGSGITSFQLPPVPSFAAACAFSIEHACLGSDLLLACWPQRGGR